jgi:hypothetical protein
VKRIFAVLVFLLVWQWPVAAQTQQPVRVKCGGPAYTDSRGQAWSADFGFNGGQVSSYAGPVSGTSDPALFQHGRWSDSPTLTYSFPAANGSYHVNLYFVENYSQDEKIGGRVFNVKVGGTTVFPNLDVFAAVGANAALIKSTDTTVTNGSLQIQFDNVVDHAKIEAIEILPASGPSAPSLTLQFNYPDGTTVSGTLNYVISSSLVSFHGTKPLTNGQVQCQLFANPSSMGVSAQFQVNLSLTDTAGHTLWQINLAMNPSQVNLGTVQSSTLNVVVQKT